MGLQLRGRNLAIAAVIAAGLTALAGGSAFAQSANYPPQGPQIPLWSHLPDWDSVWERGGDLVWDDRIPRGQSQVPPYNDQYMQIYKKAQARQGGRPAGGQGGQGQGAPPTGGPPAAGPPAGGQGGGGEAGFFGSMPMVMLMIRPMEVQVNPHETMITTEGGQIRRIYTDGRLHPDNAFPTPMGHSIGHWEGQTLVIDTCCLSANTMLPAFVAVGAGAPGPHSDAMHITERLYAPQPNELVDDITVEDPKAFTKPWTTIKTYYRRPDWELFNAEVGGQ
jgi:hypothetical protein